MEELIFEAHESNVRSYCRSFPAVFTRSKNATMFSEDGKAYIDFLAGAGALNYGHNNDAIKRDILAYIESDGIAHSLDMYTGAKRAFLEEFSRTILEPKALDYKVQFCGSTGTNAIEAALKLARKVKRRAGIFSFMGGYHGMSLGSLATTGNRESRAGAGVPLTNVTFVPYPAGAMQQIDTIAYIEAIVNDSHSGVEKPAAIVFETVQSEGGVNIAPIAWMHQLRALCDDHDILLICDDIQAGCYRTGSFFSFERAAIVPDMVTLSKSISGYGFPMSLLLMRPALDQWQPGEHNGTFRGNQLAFVAAASALKYATAYQIEREVAEKGAFLEHFLTTRVATLDARIQVRGVGMIWGIDLANIGGAELARSVARRCFEQGLIIERVGRGDTVLKIMPPLTIELALLERGCAVIVDALQACCTPSKAHADALIAADSALAN